MQPFRLPGERHRGSRVAWFRMMAVEQVEYHRAAVLERSDDHPGAALDYYGERGETPLEWGGSGADAQGLDGPVTPVEYEAVFGKGGARSLEGDRLVSTRRPGMELVISAGKSVSELGVAGRADDMRQIHAVEVAATLEYLDAAARREGGRRGRTAASTPTGGLTWARTTHFTSRAGDPHLHEHVLVANVVEMRDGWGGWKALNTAAIRDRLVGAALHAQEQSAREAERLGYAVDRAGLRRDGTPRLTHWSIRGVPAEVVRLHSKRAAETTRYVEAAGLSGYKARSVAARATRAPKSDDTPERLMPRWRRELERIGWAWERLCEAIDFAGRRDRESAILRELQARRSRGAWSREDGSGPPSASEERKDPAPVADSPGRERSRDPDWAESGG